MPRIQSLARVLRSLSFRKNSNSNKSNRSSAPMLIAAVALMAAVAFSVSVESRRGRWLGPTQPATPAAKPEVAKSSSAHSDAVKTNAARSTSPTFVAPFAPTVTATKTDFFVDGDGDLKAEPGDTIKYTVVIGATGEDATGVSFSDTVDTNTAFVPGSLQTTPLARNDSFSATGNVRIQVPAPGVLTNDQDFDGVGPALNVTAGTFLSAQGGNVTLNADGSFTYNPAPGFEGSDSFTYTLNDGEGPGDTGTVAITVSGMIWFINNNAPACLTLAAGCGRLTNPFSTLAAFAGLNNGSGNNPAANDNIFLYESATAYTGTLILLNGQKFIGQDANAGLASIAGITLAPNSDTLPDPNPTATLVTVTSGGAAITVAQNNILRGYTGGNAAPDITGSGFVTLNISEVTLNGTGGALTLTNGALTATIASITAGGTGINLNTVSGSLVSGATTISSPTGIGINIASSSAAVDLNGTSVTSSAGTGVSLTSNSGAISFDDLDISPNANQRGLLATENSGTITITSGDIITTGATAVEITRGSLTTPLVVSLSKVSANGGTNGIKLGRTSGSFTVTGTATTDGTGGVIQTTSNRGVDANIVSNLTLKNMTFTNAGNVDLDGTNGGLSSGDNLDTNAAIHLVSVTTATLDNVDITGGAEQGINGNGVSSFSLLNSTITNVGNGADEDNIHFFNMTGTSAITNTTLTHTAGGGDDNLNLQMQSGTLNLTISGGSAVGTGGGVNQLGSGYLFGIRGTANATITLSSTSSTNNFSGGIVADSFDTAIMNVIVNNTTSSGNNDQLSVSAGDNSDVDLTVTGSTLSAPLAGDFLPINLIGSSLDNGYVFDASITGNTITVGNGRASDGITVDNRGGGAMNLLINGNTFNYAGSQRAILMQAGTDGNSANNITITGNNIDIQLDGAGNAVAGILAQSAITGPGVTSSLCADIGGAGAASNTFTHSLGGVIPGGDIRVRQRNDGTMRLPGYVGGATDTAAVIAYLNGRNVEVSSSTATADSTGFAGGGACTQPTITGSITSEATASASKADGLTAEAVSGRIRTDREDILWANPAEKLEGAPVIGVSQTDLQWIFPAALEKWRQAGISNEDLMKMQAMRFEIADLPDAQLASSNSSVIKIDETAAGYGWYVDLKPVDHEEFLVPVPGRELQVIESSVAFGRVDLLTVVMRQLGNVLDKKEFEPGTPKAWLMQNSLSPAVRRLPDSTSIQLNSSFIGVAGKAKENSLASHVRSKTEPSSAVSMMNAKSKPVSKQTFGQNRRVMNHAARNRTSSPAPMSFVDVLINIGLLPAGKSVTITFDVTVDNPWQGATNQVSNQGSVTGTNFGPVLTDDPDVPGAANPTVTTIDQPDVTVAVSPASVLEDGSDNLVYTFTREGSTAAALTVNFSVGGTATFNTDYTQTGAASFNAGSGTVTIPIGSSTAAVTLDPTADITVEGNETAILTVVSGTSYDVGTPASASGTITNDDTDVTVAVAPSSVEEDGAPNLVYTFTRNGVTTGPLTVNFSIGGTATFNTDYTQTGAATFTPPTGTVTFGAGNTTATVTVDPTADNEVESNETVILTLAAGTGYTVAAPSEATGTITNDDAEVTLAVAPLSVDEDGAPNLVYTFTRTGDTTDTLTVNFTIGGTATFNTDYTQTGATTFTPPNGTVTFTAGSPTATVTVDPSADATAEPNETVILTLAAGTGYNIGTPSMATGTINNDDTTVSVAVSPLATDEDSATNLVYTFTRSDSSGALTVNFSIGGTATFSTDYTQTGAATFTPPNGTVTFADGSLTATVTVDPSADTSVEPAETVILTVVAGTGYTVGAPASATGTITNDDTDVSVAVSPLSTTEDGAGNLVYTFTRTGVTVGALSVNFTINGTATFSTDYTQTGATTFTPPTGTVDFVAGSSTATVTVDPTADNSVEPDETVILTVALGTGYNVGTPSAATGTITNDDAAVTVAVAPSAVDEDGVPNLVYTFTRTGSTTAALTVNFTIGGTADFSTDYTQTGAATFVPPNGTVIIGAGNSTATVTVDPSADAATEPNETVILTVVAGTGYEVGVPDSATGTINNDDNAVSVAVSPLSTAEDGVTNLVYTFTRGDSSGELTVNFSIGGTATFSTDYTQTGAATFTPPNGTVTFADGSLTATVTVDPSADTAVEPDETVTLTVVAGSGYTVGVPASATGTITNDDTDVSVAVSPLSTTEDGAGNLVYTFTRTGVTTGPLTVNFSLGGTADSSTDYTQTGATTFTPPTGTVSFVAGSSTAIVTVDPTADGAAELGETVILTVTAGTGYNVGAPSSATGTITNDDTEVSVAVSPSSVLEDGATNMVYTFTRTGVISGALTVNFSVSGTAVFAPPGGDYFATGGSSFTATAGTVDFLAGSSTATITVDPLGDADLEANETVILTVVSGAGYTVGTPSSATGTILNDDNSPPTVVVGYGQCGGGSTTGTLNLLVNDVETPAGSLILSATSSNTAVVPLANISFGGSGANRTVTIDAVPQATLAFSDVTITVSDGTFTSSINIRVIVGTNKTETINIGTTTVGTDMIFGGNGDDTINSGAGNDLICGGNGGGIVSAGLGDDTVDGGNGDDTLRGQDGNDLILGGGGNDTLEGGNNNDTLDGGAGTDTLRGENGDDTLTGGSGPDSFDGGPGNDTATDFNVGQGDTKDASVEIASLFGANNWGGVFAYFAPPIQWWISPDVYLSSRYHLIGPMIANKQ